MEVTRALCKTRMVSIIWNHKQQGPRLIGLALHNSRHSHNSSHGLELNRSYWRVGRVPKLISLLLRCSRRCFSSLQGSQMLLLAITIGLRTAQSRILPHADTAVRRLWVGGDQEIVHSPDMLRYFPLSLAKKSRSTSLGASSVDPLGAECCGRCKDRTR